MGVEQGSREDGPATAGWLTRGKVADRLGIAVATVRRLEGTKLHPVRGEGGIWLFDPLEVSALSGRRKAPGSIRGSSPPEGGLAAAAFGLFEEGKAFSTIVRELRQPPAVIRGLHREWLAGFAGADQEDAWQDGDLEAQRERDERELLAWEKRMLDLQEREDEAERRDRLARQEADLRFSRRRHAGG